MERAPRLLLEPPSSFQPGDIAAAPWVIADNPGWHLVETQPDPYPTLQDMRADAQCAYGHALSLVPSLAGLLNSQNGTQYSSVFWRVMFMPWLLTMTQAFLAHTRRADNLISKYGDQSLSIGLAAKDTPWNFGVTQDIFQHGLFQTDFNAWLISEIIRARLPRAWKAEEKTVAPRACGDLPSRYPVWKYPRLYSRFHVGGTSILERIQLAMRLKRKAPRPDTFPPGQAAGFPDAALFRKILEQTMPSYFRRLAAWAPPAPLTRAGKLVISPDLYFTPYQKYINALRAEAGERLVSAQHGGGYGDVALFSLVEAVEYALEKFISWGWKSQGDNDVRALPLPSPYLSKFSRESPTPNMIFVGGFMTPFFYRLDSRPQPAQFAACAADKLAFLDGLAGAVRSRLRYRGVPRQPGAYDDLALVAAHAPDIPPCEGDLHSQLMRASLVILDNPGTTLNITMAANVPTLAFWDRALWVMTDESEVLFDRLRAAGILHDGPQSAADHLNAIADDVEGWWQKPQTQAARKDWADMYARTSLHWRREWASALRSL